MENKVSILIPAYNKAQYISECLDSIQKQSYTNWEAIVVDDGSTDSTQEVVADYISDKIIYFKQENAGTSTARNKAIKESSGNLLLPLDADDILNPEALEELVKAYELNPELLIIYSDTQSFGESNGVSSVPETLPLQEILIGNRIFNTSLFQKKDLKNEIFYDTHIVKGPEDWEFWLHLRSKYPERPVQKIPYKIFKYRAHPNSKSKNLKKDTERFEAYNRYIFEKHIKIYQQYYPSYIKILREKIFYEKKIKKIYTHPIYKMYNKIVLLLKK